MIYALLTSFLFSTMGILAKYLYKYNIDANVLFFSSSIISAIFIFFGLLIKYKNFSFLKVNKKDLIYPAIYAGLFCLFLANGFVLQSLQFIDSGIQRLITYSNPIFIILIYSLFLKQKISKDSFITITLMLVGLFLVVGKMNFSGDNIFVGLVYALLSSICIAVYSVLSEKENSNIDKIVYWFYAFLFSTIYSAILLLILQKPMDILLLPDIKFQSLLIIMALSNFTIPYILFLKSISTIGAERTGVIMTLTIVLSIFFGVIILNESITFLQLIGSIFIIIASLLSGLKK